MNRILQEAKLIISERPELAEMIAKLWNERHVRAPKTNLTKRQRDVLEFLKQYSKEHGGACPSYREIQNAVNLASKSGVNRLVTGLEERGFIIRNEGRSRSIRVI